MKFLSSSSIAALLLTTFCTATDFVSIVAELHAYCYTAGPNTYVAARYENVDRIVPIDFDQCFPYQLPTGELAEVAVFCKTATCSNNPNPDCSGGAVPPNSAPIPAGVTLVNVVDFVQLLGQGATCQRNGFS